MAAIPVKKTCPTIDAIWQAYEANGGDGFRPHLGASLIGSECERALWYSWRWVTRAQHAGRLLRLFQTGHLAEARFVADLRAAGVSVWEVDEETDKQFGVEAVRGHFKGSADGVAIGLLDAPDVWTLLEFKTHSSKSFNDLEKNGVYKAKPMHYSQMQVYLYLLGLPRAYYMAVNKDTDALYSEIVPLDETHAKQMIAKAERIINSPVPPPGISKDPSFYLCKFCNHSQVCFKQEPAERNCRTCIFASPVEHGQWECGKHHTLLTTKEQRHGCMTGHRLIPDLVPGEQVDAAADGSWIKYRLPDGSEWVDGKEEAA